MKHLIKHFSNDTLVLLYRDLSNHLDLCWADLEGNKTEAQKNYDETLGLMRDINHLYSKRTGHTIPDLRAKQEEEDQAASNDQPYEPDYWGPVWQ